MPVWNKKKAITLRGLLKDPRAFTLPGPSGLCVLGDRTVDQHMLPFLPGALLRQEWFGRLVGADFMAKLAKESESRMKEGWSLEAVGAGCSRLIATRYCEHVVEQGAEPEWAKHLSPDLLFDASLETLIQDGEGLAICELSRAGIRYRLERDSLVGDLSPVAELHRLQKIRQLSYLRDPLERMMGVENITVMPFQHNRLVHSYDVYALCSLMGHNARLSPGDLHVLLAAACSHDYRTPKGGDTVKVVDPDGLDEDQNFPDLYLRKGWERFRKKYGIDESLLTETILGRGLLGRMLDLADKVAYVSADVRQFVHENPKPAETLFMPYEYPLRYQRILSLLRKDPLVCSVWDAGRVIEGEFVVTDSERLGNFLLLRALMTKLLYYNPYARFLEDSVVKIVLQCLYADGRITTKWLLSGNDEDLELFIAEETGISSFDFAVQERARPIIEEFATRKEAHARVAMLLEENSRRIAHVDESKSTNAGATDKFLVSKGGRIQTFAAACPHETADILQVLESEKPFRVYSYKVDDFGFKPEFLEKLLAHQQVLAGKP